MTPVVRCESVEVQLGWFALGPCSFVLEAGEVLCLRGPNGSGKSTLLSALLGLQSLAGGHVEIHGQEVTRRHPPLRTGVVLDGLGFYDWVDGRTNLRLSCFGDRTALGRVDQLLDEVGLTEARRKAVHAYSKGMRQRLALARALLFEPTLLMLDEPTNGLDSSAVDWLVELVRRFAARRDAVIVATHDQDFADRVAGRQLLMDAGAVRTPETP